MFIWNFAHVITSVRWGFSPSWWNRPITPLWRFWLRVLSLFSRSRAQVELLDRFLTLYGSNDVSRVLLGVRMIGDIIRMKYAPNPYSAHEETVSSQNVTIQKSHYLRKYNFSYYLLPDVFLVNKGFQIGSNRYLRMKQRPPITLRKWSTNILMQI